MDNTNNTVVKDVPSATLQSLTRRTEADEAVNIDDTDLSISFLNDCSRIPKYDDKWPVQPYLTTEDDEYEDDISELSSSERKDLAEMEKPLRELWDDFEYIGLMLSIIKGERLYRETHASFAAYCKDRLGMDHINNRKRIK